MTALTTEEATLLNGMAARLEVLEAAATASAAETAAQRSRADGLETVSNMLNQRLEEARARHETLEISLQQAQQEMTELRASSSGGKGRGPGVIDTRTIGRPDHFKGDKARWKQWSVVFKGLL